MNSQRPPPVDLKNAFIRGAAWSMAMRWTLKALGLVNTAILARLLGPADFGLIALAMLVVGITESLANFGAEASLLREQKLDRDIIDSAWSLRLVQGAVVAFLLLLSAPAAGEFLNEPRIVAIIWAIAAAILVSAFGNIGITVARKTFDFSLEYRFQIYTKVITIVGSLGAALYLGDYRALLVGIISGYVSAVPLGYLMHPYRPRWSTLHFKRMWNFGKWLFLAGILGYASRNLERIIVGKVADSRTLGILTMGAELGEMPTAELGPPIMRAFLPTFSEMQGDEGRIRWAVLRTLEALNTILMPAACGFALLSVEITELILGAKWFEVAPLLTVFAIAGLFKVAVAPLDGLFILQGHSRLHTIMMVIEVFAFTAAAVLLYPRFGVIGLAYSRLVASISYFAVNLHLAQRFVNISRRDSLRALWRPALGSALMWSLLSADWLPRLPSYAGIITVILLGILVYGSFMAFSWYASGKPEGLEATILRRMRGI